MTKSGLLSIIRRVSVAALENNLKASRTAIVDLLKTHGAMGVEQLAGKLAVSKVCVRRHLGVLESDGLVSYEQQYQERGRPRFIYKLTDKARCLFPHSYDEFAKEVLAQLQCCFGDEALQTVLSARADNLIVQLKGEMKGRSFDEQVKRLTKVITTKGYLAEAQRMKDGAYRLRQRNCPTESVAVAYPKICEEELRVYQEALGCEVTRECRIADGARVCEFRLTPLQLTQISSTPKSNPSQGKKTTRK